MAYYVLEDDKTVAPYSTTRGGILLWPGEDREFFLLEQQVKDARLFAVHPDKNSLCSRDEEGRILYKGERFDDKNKASFPCGD